MLAPEHHLRVPPHHEKPAAITQGSHPMSPEQVGDADSGYGFCFLL